MDPFFRKLKNKMKFDPDKFEKRKNFFLKEIKETNLSKYLEKDIHEFINYPFYLWIAGIILLISSLFLSFLLLIDLDSKDKHVTFYIVNIIVYYTSFYLFYVGQTEKLIINRKVKLKNKC